MLMIMSLFFVYGTSTVFAQQDEQNPMSFFITSVGSGNGGDLGGLAGADAHCQQLAANVGRGDATWRAYLSTQGPNAVNARDRIGAGPWHNTNGVAVARDLSHLHGDTIEDARRGNGIHEFHAVTENGEPVTGMMAAAVHQNGPSLHDILTGSMADGRAYTDGDDHTCSNWTSSSDEGGAQIGHHDRIGFADNSWNSSHATGCSAEGVTRGGGAGFFYCFAID
jgi:hypothetical protein